MEPLLETKLHIPRWRSSLVSRPRLIERLNQESERKLTLVSAPAGFGKSTLLADWLTTSPENCTLQAIRTMPTGAKGARMDAKPQLSPLRKVSGIAALVEAATFVVGFALFFTLIADADYGSLDIDPVENAEFLADNQAIMYVWNLIIYVVFGIVLVVLALALHEQLKVTSPALMQTATVFGFIWAGLVIASGMVANIGAAVVVEIYDTDPVQAATVWLSLQFVVDGLGGGNEIVGGIWVLLVSRVALRSGAMTRALNWLGAVIGVAGILSLIPPLGEVLGAVFGLGLIVWFVWLGIVLLREPPIGQAANMAISSTSR